VFSSRFSSGHLSSSHRGKKEGEKGGRSPFSVFSVLWGKEKKKKKKRKEERGGESSILFSRCCHDFCFETREKKGKDPLPMIEGREKGGEGKKGPPLLQLIGKKRKKKGKGRWAAPFRERCSRGEGESSALILVPSKREEGRGETKNKKFRPNQLLGGKGEGKEKKEDSDSVSSILLAFAK